LGKNKKATEDCAAPLGQVFAYASKQLPGKTPWEVLIAHRTCFEHLQVSKRQCGATPATLKINYAKDMARVCEYARERWTRIPDMPKNQQFVDELKERHVFWKDQQAVFGEQTAQARNAKLSTGTAKVADLDYCYEYIGDAQEIARIDSAFERLESAARLTTSFVISRKDTAVLEAWNSVARYLMVVSLIENASRPGVLENITIEEVENADRIRGTCLIQVAKHKRSKDGAAYSFP